MKRSLKGYRWRWAEGKKGCAENLIKSLGISPTLANLLASRGICEKERGREFLNPSLKYLNDPFLMRDMREAVERVVRAIRGKERIMIHGDYDADGVTSTALLYLALQRVGVKAEVYLPRRGVEGYGLSASAIEEAVKKGVDLIITVDCGSSAHKEVEMAGEEGIDVVITDHHEISHPLPSAEAVVNPKRRDDLYPFKGLAGVGVAFKLLQGLEKAGLPVQPIRDIDLVAIGTLADVVPLIEENRTLVVEGLRQIPFTEKAGLRELLKEGRIDLARPTTTRDVVFSIAPRINVPGRMGNPMLAFELLTTESPLEAELYMMELLKEEKRKQEAVERITREVMKRVSDEDLVVVEAGEGWEEGVLGIVANRVLDHFGLPSIILTIIGDEARGSARAPSSVNIIEALQSVSGLNMDFGGHQHAAGVKLPSSQIDALRDSLAEYMKKRFRREELGAEIVIEGVISPEEITEEFVEDVERLAP
ncbi:MAG: single-stranded-DNA-specific exonuclease RecJ, partial [Thermoplasmata archaeon]|nr:single-stranded-DNA-specific exonuclease RecJ [Thermoplasmata archaeon]